MKMQTEIKEYDFGTVWKLLMITANEIAYPKEAPVNTSDKTPPEGFKKYSLIDWRNITDNHGWIPARIDYTKFKPKKYFKDVEQEVLQKHLEALQKKEDLLKHFKHSEDFDRIDYITSMKSNTYENHIDKMMFCHAVLTLMASRIILIQTTLHKFSYTLWRNTFKRLYFITLPLPFIAGLFYQVANPANHEYFRSPPHEVRMYEIMAYDADAFQYNNDIKYNFKFPERDQFYETVENVYDKRKDSMHEDAIRYYKKVYGIIDREPFLKNNKKTSENQAV